MNAEVILRNYSEYKQYMLWNGDTCKTIVRDKINESEQGIVGHTENKELVGVFVQYSEAFF